MTRIGQTLLAGAVVAGLGAFAATQPARAAIATYDLVYSMPAGMSATGSISLDTALLGGNTTCAFGNGCGFTAFSTVVNISGLHFTFAPVDLDPLTLTVTGGVPTEVFVGVNGFISSAENIDDIAGLYMSGNGWNMKGVIDGFEFNVSGTYAFAAPGGGEPDPVGVPEPATLMLFGAGLAGAALMRRKGVSAA